MSIHLQNGSSSTQILMQAPVIHYTICIYPIKHLDRGQYTGTFTFMTAQLHTELKNPYIGLQSRCSMDYAQMVFRPFAHIP